MKESLQKDLLHYRQSISICAKEETKDFILTDNKSCNDCNTKSAYFARSCTEHGMLKIHCNTHLKTVIAKCCITLSDFETAKINIENAIQDTNNIDLRSGGCCDYLVYDDNKIALIELTCSRPEYINDERNGKRTKAYKQLSDTIKKITSLPNTNIEISKRGEKTAIFGIREKVFALEQADKFQTSMISFTNVYRDITRKLNNGFILTTITYPNTYTW